MIIFTLTSQVPWLDTFLLNKYFFLIYSVLYIEIIQVVILCYIIFYIILCGMSLVSALNDNETQSY